MLLGYSVPSQPEPETFEGEWLWLEPEGFLCRQPEIETLSIMIAYVVLCSTSNSKKKNCATVCHANHGPDLCRAAPKVANHNFGFSNRNFLKIEIYGC